MPGEQKPRERGQPVLSPRNADFAADAHAKLDQMLAQVCRRGSYGEATLSLVVADGTLQRIIALAPLS